MTATTTKTLTANEISERYALPLTTIQYWVDIKKLIPVGKRERPRAPPRNLYRESDVRALLADKATRHASRQRSAPTARHRDVNERAARARQAEHDAAMKELDDAAAKEQLRHEAWRRSFAEAMAPKKRTKDHD